MAKPKPKSSSISPSGASGCARISRTSIAATRRAGRYRLPRYLLLRCHRGLVFVALWYGWLSSRAMSSRPNGGRKSICALPTPASWPRRSISRCSSSSSNRSRVYVNQLEKQLPSKAEMDALLSDINQAGLGRSLQFELFRPGSVNVQEYYAEQPIALRVSGGYHDIALFAADIAALSRIVTLNDLSIAPVANKPNLLTLEATAKTFRYLDPDEVLVQQAAAKAAAKKGKQK